MMSDLSRFVRTDEACRRSGLSERNLARRIADGEIPAFRDPRDRRWRLIRIDDLPDLVGVVPFERRRSRAVEEVAS